MSTTLYRVGEASVTVRDPGVPVRKERVRVQSQKRTLDGSLKQHIADVKWRWSLLWELLSTSQYNTLITELDREQSMTFSPPDTASSYTVAIMDVRVIDNPFGTRDVSAVLEEV